MAIVPAFTAQQMVVGLSVLPVLGTHSKNSHSENSHIPGLNFLAKGTISIPRQGADQN